MRNMLASFGGSSFFFAKKRGLEGQGFHDIRTPTLMPYDLILLGKGVVFNILLRFSQRKSPAGLFNLC